MTSRPHMSVARERVEGEGGAGGLGLAGRE